MIGQWPPIDARPYGRIPAPGKDEALLRLVDTALADTRDGTVWEELLNALRTVENITTLPFYNDAAKRRALEDGFFAYVEHRDNVRSQHVKDCIRRNGTWQPDAHAQKIQDMVKVEAEALARVMAATGLDNPDYFCHLGCGSTPETMLYLHDFAARGLVPAPARYIGIDNRPSAARDANEIFGLLNFSDCRTECLSAAQFKPGTTAPGVILTAAYLHPHKTAIIRDALQNIEGPAVLMVRNMTNGHALFDDVVDDLKDAQRIASVTHPQLGVRTDYYLYSS